MATDKIPSAPTVLGASWDSGTLRWLLQLRPKRQRLQQRGQVTWEPTLLVLPLFHLRPLDKATPLDLMDLLLNEYMKFALVVCFLTYEMKIIMITPSFQGVW